MQKKKAGKKIAWRFKTAPAGRKLFYFSSTATAPRRRPAPTVKSWRLHLFSCVEPKGMAACPKHKTMAGKSNNNNISRQANDSSRKTVTFNVGGVVYKVSRSVLDVFPDSMMTRMASEEWQQQSSTDEDQASESDALFIDRDGERFRYCLGLHERRKSDFTIRKGALLQDMVYYGFESVCTAAIVYDETSVTELTKRVRSIGGKLVNGFLCDVLIVPIAPSTSYSEHVYV